MLRCQLCIRAPHLEKLWRMAKHSTMSQRVELRGCAWSEMTCLFRDMLKDILSEFRDQMVPIGSKVASTIYLARYAQELCQACGAQANAALHHGLLDGTIPPALALFQACADLVKEVRAMLCCCSGNLGHPCTRAEITVHARCL